MKILPQGNIILIEVEKEKETKSGLVLNTEDIILEKGTILEVGPKVENENLKKGVKILFKSWAIDKVEICDREFIHLAEDKVLSIYEDDSSA